ncbi:MAG TPA: heparinase II/III family protein [Aeromicrobium sp.]|nr:heparinase II/III family protein [Aeromicrobium sp.]HKY57468.1 heparinase II/III family protein [Aeromicrobium sp.]
MTDVLESAIHDLIYDAPRYWPDDSYFHRRNRQKLARAWSRLTPLHDLSRSTVVDRYIDILERRRDRKIPTLYAMSNGGSGCHFLGQLLDGLDGLQLTDEVYFPPRLLKDIADSGDERSALALDFINFFHAGTVEPEHHDLRIVNIGHVHPDTPPAHLARMDTNGHFILLIRNPYDIAVSRAFRKPEYRAQTAPQMSDDEYLQRQVDGTKAFLSRARAFQWHNVVRYEDLISDPAAAVGPLVRDLGLTFDEDQFAAVRHRLDASRTSADAGPASSGNLNTQPQESLTPRQIEILHDGLADLASEFGYEESNLMTRSRQEQANTLTGPSVEPWLPQHIRIIHYTEERFARLDAGYLTTSTYLPEIEMTPDPTWTADPFGNRTWRLYYHSLGWLLAYGWGVDHGPDPEASRRRLGDTVSSYLAANVFSPAADDFAWDDHATADRLAILLHLWVGYLSEPAGLLDEGQFQSACELHVDKLVEFYESKTWLDSNHGLIHALALLSFASVFTTSRLATTARTVGSDYLTTVVANLVDLDEGVSLEQAPAYHQIDLRLLRSGHEFLAQSHPALALLIDRVTDRMVDFNLCVRTAADIMPAIGDTHLTARFFAGCLTPAPGEETTDHVAYVLSHGRLGTPYPPLVVYPRSGYSVFRRGEVFDGEVTRGIFVHHPERVAHGHFDALSLILHVDGRDLLVDSGGPYVYGDALRFSYFMASRAHNVLLLDDRDHRAPSRLVGHGESLDCQWVTAEHAGYEGRTVSRTVVAVADGGFVVLDAATPGTAESSFDLLWHFAPESRVTPTVDGRRTTTSIQIGKDRFTAHSVMSVAPTVEVVEGRLEPTPQGWVTDAPESKRPAPVLVASARGTSLLAVTVFVRDGTRVVTKLAGDSAVVKLSGRKISFTLGQPPKIARAHGWPSMHRLRTTSR